MSAGPIYSGFLAAFDFYGGVGIEVLKTATFWFYVPLAVMVALTPTIITRILKLDLNPHLVDDVRLLQKKDGPQLFTRRKIKRKTPSIRGRSGSVHRTGYAFAQEAGFGTMITNGRAFGMDQEEVQQERHRRMSQLIMSHPPTPTRSTSPNVASGLEASLGVAASMAISQGEVEVEVHVESPLEVDVSMEEAMQVKVMGSEGGANLPGSVTSSDDLPNTEVVSGHTSLICTCYDVYNYSNAYSAAYI